MTTIIGSDAIGVRPKRRGTEPPMGQVLLENLQRFGYAELVIRATDLAKLINEKTDKKISRQRIAALPNAIRINPETIGPIAEALGVDPSELMRH